MDNLLTMLNSAAPPETLSAYFAGLDAHQNYTDLQQTAQAVVGTPLEQRLLDVWLSRLEHDTSTVLHQPPHLEFIAHELARTAWTTDLRSALLRAALTARSITGSFGANYVLMFKYGQYARGVLRRWCERGWFEALACFPSTGEPALGCDADPHHDGQRLDAENRQALLCEVLECSVTFPQAVPHLVNMLKFAAGIFQEKDFGVLERKLQQIQRWGVSRETKRRPRVNGIKTRVVAETRRRRKAG